MGEASANIGTYLQGSVWKLVELGTPEHKGSSNKNDANNNNTNSANCESEYHNDADKTNVNNANKTNDKLKSKSNPGKVVEDLREGLREGKNR